MTLTAATILLYLVALILTVATLWPFSYPTQTTGPQSVWVLIIVGIPFVMLIYFGLAFLISDTISEGGVREDEPSVTEGLVAAVSYVGLSGWLWLRWRNPTPSARILGPAIIATLIIFIIVSVIWAAPNDQIF
jgi:hypothetical protein